MQVFLDLSQTQTMDKPVYLLFEKRYGRDNIKLFLNRLDLVNHLLYYNLSKYKLPLGLKDEMYPRESNRLQTYVSHLLSGTGKRKITNDFIESLGAIIDTKLGPDIIDKASITKEIINSIEAINNSATKQSTEELFDEYIYDQTHSKYIAVFTSNPIELEANPNDYLKKIRGNTINALVSYAFNSSAVTAPVLKYRYNLPDKTTCILLWRKIALLVVKYLITNSKENEFSLAIEKLQLSYNNSDSEVIQLKYKVDAFLEYCNNSKLIEIYHLEEPVFVIPHTVFNPNEIHNGRGYLMLDYVDNTINLHKWSIGDFQTWRQYVWNVLKERNTGKSIKYVESSEQNTNQPDLYNL